MNLTRAQFARLRRFPTFDASDKPVREDMQPRHGLTPAISGTGHKRYVEASRKGVYFAEWEDAREQVPVTFFTWEEWRARR